MNRRELFTGAAAVAVGAVVPAEAFTGFTVTPGPDIDIGDGQSVWLVSWGDDRIETGVFIDGQFVPDR